MHFVVMGCGRVGAEVALNLEQAGHDVAVIDRDAEAFRRLGADFSGRTVEGVGFDRQVLLQAGIDDAYALAAVSSGDNSNILSARVARESFGVSSVVARIYDPKRAAVYQRMGIPTVATVRWTAGQILRWMLPAGTTCQFTDSSGMLKLVEVGVHAGWVGRPVSAVQATTGARVAYLSRVGEGLLPAESTLLQEGDVAFVMLRSGEESHVASILNSEPETLT